MKKVIIVGSGNAALCAGIAALEKGASVLMLEKAPIEQSGGNSRYTAGAMRFVYNSGNDLIPLLRDVDDERIGRTDFGSYPVQKFRDDLLMFNDGNPLTMHQEMLIDKSLETVRWLGSHNIRFAPIYSRQTFLKDGRYIFWGGLTMEAEGEGVGLVDAEMEEFKRLGGEIQFEVEASSLITKGSQVTGVRCLTKNGMSDFYADSIVLGCGGFEANPDLRAKYLGPNWVKSKVRGTPHNQGAGITMALETGAAFYGKENGCHAVPMDLHMSDYGNLNLPFIERKHYRKICYFLGIMLNAHGKRFVDEGKNFRNYTYAQFGKAILDQPGSFAWQIFDQKVDQLLYSEYRFHDATFVEADTLEELAQKMEGVDHRAALSTLKKYNLSVDHSRDFDPTILDGRRTNGLSIDKTNWANTLDTPPFKAYPVTCGITFTYAGLKTDRHAAVLDENDRPINGLFACGELVGGVFYHGYPGGSGLTSGAVFGRIAGYSASQF